MNTLKKQKSKVIFYRRLLSEQAGCNGGNLKLKDCYDHITHSDNFQPYIYFSEDTVWHNNPGNHWTILRDEALSEWKIAEQDILFFSGSDWLSLSEKERKNSSSPIINIVQPRHARREDKRNAFLKYPAIRFTKSEAGAAILRKHGVNGPLYVIPDTIDLSLLPEIPKEKDIDILVIGLKQPQLAQAVFDKLQSWKSKEGKELNIHIQLPPRLPTRQDFLSLLSRSKTVVCIPLEEERGGEGFYLPALEAMALKSLVVCPHAIGNIDHCIDGVNCIVAPYSADGIFKSTLEALNLKENNRRILIEQGLATAQNHRIEVERHAVLKLVKRAPLIWKQKELFREAIPIESPKTISAKIKNIWKNATGESSETIHNLKVLQEHENDIILTGIPRSGTTLTCLLLSQLPDFVALNEPMTTAKYRTYEAALRSVPEFYKMTRKSILEKGLAMARGVNGKMTDNHFSNDKGKRIKKVNKQIIEIEKDLAPNFKLGVKHNALFTLLQDDLIKEYPMYAIIRSPISILGSWNSLSIPASRGEVRAASWILPEISNSLNKIDDLHDRQLYILNWYFEKYLSLPSKNVIKYESIIDSDGAALSTIDPGASNIEKALSSKNKNKVYDEELMSRLAEKLLSMDHACWEFYDKSVVASTL